MEEIFVNRVEASTEKHLPVVTISNQFVEVKVGLVTHPMEDEHYINFVAVETTNGYIIKTLAQHELPECKIYVGEDKVISVYEYCNLHGLWKIDI